MNDWMVNTKEGVSEQGALLARLFWQFEFDVKQKIVYTSKELAKRYGISEPQLRKIQEGACTVQAPDTQCRQCHVGLLWRAKSFSSRGDFQQYVAAWKASVCNECRTANEAKQKAEREAQDRTYKAQAAERKEKLRARYADKAIGDCPQCEGVLILRKSQANNGMFVGCSSFPECRYTAPIPKAKKLTDEEIAEAKRLLADAPKCGKCGAAMRKIEGRFGTFLGCSNYPRCRQTVSLTVEPTQPKAPVGNNVLPTEPQPLLNFEEQERARMQAELAKPWQE